LVHKVQLVVQASRDPGELPERQDIPVRLETEELWDSQGKLDLPDRLDHRVRLEIGVIKDSQEHQESKDPKVSKVNKEQQETAVRPDQSVQLGCQAVWVPMATREPQGWSDLRDSWVSLDCLDSLVQLVRRERRDGRVRKDSWEILDSQEQLAILESLVALDSWASKVCQVHPVRSVRRGRLASRGRRV
jgi:hypothetical protein